MRQTTEQRSGGVPPSSSPQTKAHIDRIRSSLDASETGTAALHHAARILERMFTHIAMPQGEPGAAVQAACGSRTVTIGHRGAM